MAIKIFIDQGHNPQNPNAGAEGQGLREQDITYTIGVLLANMLNANPNYEAALSRTTPTEVLGTSTASSLRIRVERAIAFGADYFISLHTNASINAAASGCEGYAYSTVSPGFGLGTEIISHLSTITGLENRGMFVRPTLYVLRRTPMPAVLIEMGFITNANDAYLMNTQPELFALGIYNGILAFTS